MRSDFKFPTEEQWQRRVGWAKSVQLDSREVEMLTLAARGASDKEISSVVGLSDKRVYVLMSRARERLGGLNRTEAITLAIACGHLPLILKM